MRGAEVRDADGPDPPLGEQPLGRPVRVDRRVEGLGQRLVQQVQVDGVEAELAGAHVERVQRSVVAVVADPQLGLDEQLGPRRSPLAAIAAPTSRSLRYDAAVSTMR